MWVDRLMLWALCAWRLRYRPEHPRVEREDAERARALIELSRLRKVPLATLMTEFGLVLNA